MKGGGILLDAMKHTLLPTLALATLAAAASAQTVPVKPSAAPSQLSVGISWAQVSDSIVGIGGPAGIDTTGYTVDLRAALAGNTFLTASYTGASVDDIASTDISSYSIGIGGKFAAGNGTVEAAYAFRQIDVDSPGYGKYDQHLVKLSYGLDLGSGFNVSLGVLQVFNSESGIDDVTAPVLTVGYGNGKGFGAEVSVSNENTLLGLSDGGTTTAVGVRYGF